MGIWDDIFLSINTELRHKCVLSDFNFGIMTWYQCCDIEISCTYVFMQLQIFALYHTVYPKKYAHGLCFAVLCCGYTLTDFPISIRLTSLALWQSNDCPSASKATLMNMDKYLMWIHYERLHNHKKSKAQQNRVHISWDILYIRARCWCTLLCWGCIINS